MARQAQQGRVEAIYRTVEQQPGIRPGQVAEELGLNRSEVTRYLPALEEQGMLLSEDKKGRLWPFSRKQQ